MNWPTVAALCLLLAFVMGIFIYLLKVKRIDSENTIRFACITVGVLIIVIVALVPIANGSVSTGLIGLVGTIFGYVIRDVARTRQGE